jgi:hypothetical protein
MSLYYAKINRFEGVTGFVTQKAGSLSTRPYLPSNLRQRTSQRLGIACRQDSKRTAVHPSTGILTQDDKARLFGKFCESPDIDFCYANFTRLFSAETTLSQQ